MPRTASEHHVEVPEGNPSPVGPERTGASQRTALRIGGVGALGGGVLTLLGNILHPREAGQLDDAESLLAVAARSELWVIDHLVIMIAVSLLLAAFYGLSRSFTSEPSATWARLAQQVSIIGVLFALAVMVTEATAMAATAREWASGTESDLALATGSALFELSLVFSVGAMLFLFGATPFLFGVAMLASDDYPRWAAWAGMVFGSVALAAGTIQILARETTLTQFVLFPVAAIGITLWMIYLGGLLWRRSTQMSART